jgi:hypothetical protein
MSGPVYRSDGERFRALRKQWTIDHKARRAIREKELGLKQIAEGKAGVIVARADAVDADKIVAIAHKRCVLFLVTPMPDEQMPRNLATLKALGFEYKSQCVSMSESLLIYLGTRGKPPAPAMGTQYASVIDSGAMGKPKCWRQMVRDYFPTMPTVWIE